jgi:hypothetical protein
LKNCKGGENDQVKQKSQLNGSRSFNPLRKEVRIKQDKENDFAVRV